MHEQISYEARPGYELTRVCPNGRHNGARSIYVGSIACQNCKHFVSAKNGSLTCSFHGDRSDKAMAQRDLHAEGGNR